MFTIISISNNSTGLYMITKILYKFNLNKKERKMNKLTNGIISKCKNFSKTSYINKFDAQFSKNSEKSNIFQIFLE